MNKWGKRILIAVIAVILNVAGRYTAFHFEWPMYFNLCGTLLAAYLEGPVTGVIAAVAGCAFSSIFSLADWYYLIADVFVAVAAGLLVKHNRFFERFSLIFSATAFFTVIRAAIMIMINLSINDGKSGFYIVDAIFDYLESISSPVWLGYVLAAIFVCFSDVLAAMLLIYFGLNIGKRFRKRKRAAALKKELLKKVSLGLILVYIFTGMAGVSGAKADNVISFVEKLYNSENGLTGGCLNDMAMTADGSMWIGTYGGLFRFNGSKFVLIDNINTVRSVQTLFVDNEDRLWAGTQDAGVTLLNIDMSWVTLNMNSGLPSNSVKCVSRDSSGLYYFGTTGGLTVAEYDKGDVRIVKTDHHAGNIRDLSPDREGHMIVMNNIGGISCYENGDRIAELSLSGFSAKGIRVDNEDNIYIGTDAEKIVIYRFDDGDFRFIRSVSTPGMKTIRDFYFEENITYISADNGIGYIDENEHLTMIETGVFNNSIDHIYKDYQGNLWFTSSRCGLLCLGRSCFTDVFKLCNEKTTVCNAIVEWNGDIYVATNDGLKIIDIENGESIKNEVTEALSGIRIRSLDISNDGNLLLATYDRGVMELTPDGTLREYASLEKTSKMIRVVKVLSDGTVISSSDVGMVFMKEHMVVGELKLGTDLAGGTVLNILETGDGRLLCGTDGDGIAIIKDAKFERYITCEDGLPSGVILRVVKDPEADGYFVMTGSGMCYMDSSFKISEIRMPYYNNFDIALNKTGEIFVLGGAGIYISEYETLLETGRMDSYLLLDTKAGLPGSITSNAWNYKTDDEHLFICGTSGIYMLDLNNYEMNVEEFKTKITSVTLDGEYNDVTQVGTIFIPKDTDRIELNLEINNYTSSDPYVSYFLSGVDASKNIVLSSKLGSVTYYDIPYGNHDFVISVLDERGRELSKQTYVFSKEKELFETVGFLLYFTLMVFTFIVFIVISIVQGALWSQRRKETGRHELVVSQLEREKTEALERALHMEENANRTKSEFLANMSNEIKNPINAIIGMDTMIIRESNEEHIKKYAIDIDTAGKKLINLINNIHELSQHDRIEEFEPDKNGETQPEERNTVISQKERYHAPGAKILIIDENEMNITVTRNLLKRIEVQTDVAHSGDEAEQLAHKTPYDIILIDSKMPGSTADDTMNNIKTLCPLNAETPIVVLTTHVVKGAREEYLNLGYTNYLAKPLDGTRLEAMIESYLPDDKIVMVCDENDQTSKDLEDDSLLHRISQIEGMDIKSGIDISGGEDSYIAICRSFYRTAKKAMEMIKEDLDKGDFDNFTVMISDLKNSARLIGASEFAKYVSSLEAAGREGNIKKIKREKGELLKRYNNLYECFDKIFGE